MAKKISELEDVTNLSDGCCFPMVSHDETRKLSYGNLKDRLDEDFNFGLLAFKDSVGANEIAFNNSGTSIQATRVDNALKELDADILETQEAIPERVELTQAEYDALPDSKLTDGIDYYITDQNGYEDLIDDEITGEASTWSSEKIDGELDEIKTDLENFLIKQSNLTKRSDGLFLIPSISGYMPISIFPKAMGGANYPFITNFGTNGGDYYCHIEKWGDKTSAGDYPIGTIITCKILYVKSDLSQ